MPLLRVSEFCRRSTPPQVPVRLSTAPSSITGPNACNADVGYVSLDLLISLSLQEGSLALLCKRGHVTKSVLRLCLVASDNEERVPAAFTIHVAPIIATNLGIIDDNDASTGADEFFLQGVFDLPVVPEQVLLRPLGRAPIWPRIQKDNDENDNSWIYPATDTLIQPFHLISVFEPKSKKIYYYEVLKIAPRNNSQADFYVTSSKTKFELDSTPLTRVVRRLPPLITQQQFFRRESLASSTNTANESVQNLRVPPHPNLNELKLALGHQPRSLSANEKVIHVIGTDHEHDLRVAVETASKQIGMQCLSIRGLAAFGYHHGHPVTGSLIDQLEGLQAAFDLIRSKRMEPCVLHLYDFDTELCTTDDPLRQNQEERFWTKWMEALGTTEIENNSDTSLYTAPLLLVVSTSVPLKAGPLVEKLVFPSIQLQHPDVDYTKFLWGGDGWKDDMADLFKGLSVQDILWLREQVQTDATDNTPTMKKLALLCQELGINRRKKSSTLARISNVHWDDVGGLAHVRREIMDAIELPLKHPHLFPKSGGRSGILLYGPPGTGKTLVAKAVATECGLPFLSVKGPELLGSYVGESEASIREIFSQARKAAAQNAPIAASILFFDELDSLAPRRGGVGDGGGVMERVVATLFSELDGPGDSSSPFEDGRIFVMGATNRPDLLDPSLLRPGRLDRLVYLGIPTDQNERASVLAAQLRKLRLEGDHCELAEKVVSTLPPRLTGADLSTIASGSLLKAVQRLCQQADEEHRLAQEKGFSSVTIEKILEDWDKEKRTPIIQLDDLLEASKEVTPSVSQTDLDRYERLREQYSSNEL